MAANVANRRKTYIKQLGLIRKSPKRFCILTNVLIGDTCRMGANLFSSRDVRDVREVFFLGGGSTAFAHFADFARGIDSYPTTTKNYS